MSAGGEQNSGQRTANGEQGVGSWFPVRCSLFAVRSFAMLAAACASSPSAPDPSVSSPAAFTSPAARSTEAKLDDLQRSITELSDRLEVMSDRIQRLEAAVPEGPAAARATRVAEPPAPSAAARQVVAAPSPGPLTRPVSPPSRAVAGAAIADKYRRALSLFGGGRGAEARAAFQDVFDSDPNGELADNALYWIGETWFAAGDFSTALKYYDRIGRDFSDQNKAPDALYKSGLVYEKVGDLQLARKAFEECVSRYPYSTPASSARVELKRIKY